MTARVAHAVALGGREGNFATVVLVRELRAGRAAMAGAQSERADGEADGDRRQDDRPEPVEKAGQRAPRHGPNIAQEIRSRI